MADGPRKRHRSTKACVSCRQMKKKCDGESPCSTCARFHHDCVYRKGKTYDGSSTVEDISHGPVGINDLSHKETTSLDQSILDPSKGRYFDGSSAVAFPALVGLQFGAAKTPRLHSFAWNLGIRSEPIPTPLDITKVISLDDVHIHSKNYFMVVNPAFDFLDQQEFIHRASLRWKTSPTEDSLNFDAVICGAVALGYFVSQKSDTGIEATLIRFAKDRLESVALTKPPTIDLIAAWILRAIYLRATTRPHASWMASNIVMHLIEASGIQHDLSSVALVYPDARNARSDSDSAQKYRCQVFWVGRAINAIFSYEYSRPRVTIHKISCARVDHLTSNSTKELLQLADLIPANSHTCEDAVEFQETTRMVKSLAALTSTEVPVLLFRVDLVFAAFRHLRPLRSFTYSAPTAQPETSSFVVKMGTEALKVIEKVLSSSAKPSSFSRDNTLLTPWWSLISIPFHFILILLSLDTTESLSHVSGALKTLKAVADKFDTHLTSEAVQNATMLILLAQSQKNRDLDVLKKAIDNNANINGSGRMTGKSSGGEPSSGIGNSATLPANTQLPPTQYMAGHNFGDNSNLEIDVRNLDTSMFEGLINPENLAIDWDAIFQDTDWI